MGPQASLCDISGASGVQSSRFAHLTAAHPCFPASQDEPWGEGDEDAMPAEPGGTHGPPGAQPQPGAEQDPLVQTCLLRDLEMGPLAQTQTLRDFEQVRPWGAKKPQDPSSSAGCFQDTCWSGVWRAGVGHGAGGGGTGRGGSAPPALRSPSPPSGLRHAGAAGAQVSPPACPRRPCSGRSSNSSESWKKKKRTRPQRGWRRELRAGRDPVPCPRRRHVRGARMTPPWSTSHG